MTDIKASPASNAATLKAIQEATEAAEVNAELIADATERLVQIVGAVAEISLKPGDRLE
jgi:hypothetical protein